MVYLILCAGISRRWKHKTPKQLLTVDGETLLQRMVRQLKSMGAGEIYVVAWDRRLKVDGCGFYYSKPNTRTIGTLLDTKRLWDGGVVVLLGDWPISGCWRSCSGKGFPST